MTTSPDDFHVAIVGYGTAGQAASIALGRLPGVRVTVFEQTSQLGPIGAGFLLQPTGLMALARLGLLDQTLAHGARIDALSGHNHRGKEVMAMRYAMNKPGSAEATHGIGMQRHTLYILLDRQRPVAVQLRSGVAIQKIDSAAGTITDEHGQTHGPFALIVAADGSRSPLRSAVFGESVATPYPWGAWWCLLPAQGWPSTNELQQRYRLARQMIGVLPVGRVPAPPGLAGSHGPAANMLCLYWSAPAAQAPQGIDSHGLAPQLAALWPEIGAHVLSQSPALLSHATYRAVNLPSWRHGRAVWIGDAAHGMSPQLGQGANLALLDAVALGDALKAALAAQPRRDPARDEAVAQSLQRFEKARRRHVRWYRWGSHWLTPLFQSGHDGLAMWRDWMFAPAGRMPIIRGLSHRLLTGRLGLPRESIEAREPD